MTLAASGALEFRSDAVCEVALAAYRRPTRLEGRFSAEGPGCDCRGADGGRRGRALDALATATGPLQVVHEPGRYVERRDLPDMAGTVERHNRPLGTGLASGWLRSLRAIPL